MTLRLLNLAQELQTLLVACVDDDRVSIELSRTASHMCTQLDVATQQTPVDVALLSTIADQVLILRSGQVPFGAIRDVSLRLQQLCPPLVVHNYATLLDHVAKHILYPAPLEYPDTRQYARLYPIFRASEILLATGFDTGEFDITHRHMFSNVARQECTDPKDIATVFQQLYSHDLMLYLYPTITDSPEQQRDFVALCLDQIARIASCFVPRRPRTALHTTGGIHPDVLALVVIDVTRRLFHLFPEIELAIRGFIDRIADLRFNVQMSEPRIRPDDVSFPEMSQKGGSFLNEVRFAPW